MLLEEFAFAGPSGGRHAYPAAARMHFKTASGALGRAALRLYLKLLQRHLPEG